MGTKDMFAIVSGDGKWIYCGRTAKCPSFVHIEDDEGYRMSEEEADEVLAEIPFLREKEGYVKKEMPVEKWVMNKGVKNTRKEAKDVA